MHVPLQPTGSPRTGDRYLSGGADGAAAAGGNAATAAPSGVAVVVRPGGSPRPTGSPRTGAGAAGSPRSAYNSLGGDGGDSDAPFLKVDEPEPDMPAETPEHRRQHYSKEFTHEQYTKMAEIESLDYHLVHNDLFREEQWNATDAGYERDELLRVLVSCFVGFVIGILGFVIHTAVESILSRKFTLMQHMFDRGQTWLAFVFYAATNLALALACTLLVVFLAPAASGSGIPEVKGYLNGNRLPKTINVKTFIVKVLGTVTSVASSLPVGPEGPMIHIGAMVGGGVSQSRSKTLGLELPCTDQFFTDKDRRDFISLGSACGVSAAFGAPIGGILFSIEEASSYWSQHLTWKTFLASMITTLTNNFFTSGRAGRWGLFGSDSVAIFNVHNSGSTIYHVWEFIPFILLGVLGGVTGALFTAANAWVMRRRGALYRNVRTAKRNKILEIVFLSLIVSTAFFWLPMSTPCMDVQTHDNGGGGGSGGGGDDYDATAVTYNNYTCNANRYADAHAHGGRIDPASLPPDRYNPVSSLLLTSQSTTVNNLFTRGTAPQFTATSLAVFLAAFALAAVVSAGSPTSCGLLIPTLVIGAAMGRLYGMGLRELFSDNQHIDPGIYALIGAAAFFAGVTRMNISLCVIMLEITNDLQFLPPIMLTVVFAKGVSDRLSLPLYHILLNLKHIAFLEADPPHEMDKMTASDVMSKDVRFLPLEVDVATILRTMYSCTHNGFPVVDTGDAHDHAHNPAGAANGHANGSAINACVASASAAAAAPAASMASSWASAPVPAGSGGSTSGTVQAGGKRTLKGLILRKQLQVLIHTRVWENNRRFGASEFRSLMARQQNDTLAMDRALTLEDRRARINLAPYMNRSPFSVHREFYSIYAYRLFRSMGLRHLPVVDDDDQVVGMITRKDLIEPVIKAKFDVMRHRRGDD